MLKRLTTAEQIGVLLDRYSAAVKEAFLEAVAEVRSKIVLQAVVNRLERYDIAGAVEAIEIDRAALNPVLDEIAKAYTEGGNVEAGNMTFLRSPEGHRVVFRFDVRNPEAENWLREHGAQFVTRVVDDQRQGVRTALAEGLARGDNPRVTALDVVGRISRVTGKREGGVIGLTAQQSSAVENARQNLLSGDPERMREYLALNRRDRRFDAAVRKAIEAGRAVPTADVARITGRYSDRLLQLRGEMLARTETMFALGSARNEAMRQAIAAGNVDADLVTKRWRSTGDDRVRHSHRVLNGQSVGFHEVFVSPAGNTLRFPGDPNAPISETSGCRCTLEYKIDHTAQVLRRRAA